MTFVLVFLTLAFGFMVGKDFKTTALFEDIKKKENIIENKVLEIEEMERRIKILENAINYLQITYPEIRDNISSTIKENTDPVLVKAIESMKKFSMDDKIIKTHDQYEYEIRELEEKYRDCKMNLNTAEIFGRYVIAFRNIVIRNADKLKDEVKIISADNYDNSRIHGGVNVEIEFLKANIPNYKQNYLA